MNVCGWMSLDTGVLASRMGGAWLEALPFGARTGHGDDGDGIPPPRPIPKNSRRQSVVTSTQSWEKNRAPGAGGLIPAGTPKAMAPGFPGPVVDIPPRPPATGTLGWCLLGAPPHGLTSSPALDPCPGTVKWGDGVSQACVMPLCTENSPGTGTAPSFQEPNSTFGSGMSSEAGQGLHCAPGRWDPWDFWQVVSSLERLCL